MKPFTDLFSSSVVQSIGWTLLHSVWQAFFVFLIVKILLRVIKTSSLRYTTILAGLSTVLLISISTFIYLQFSASTLSASTLTTSPFHWTANLTEKVVSSEATTLTDLLRSNMNVIVVCWIIGAILFSLRAVGGGIYVSMLRKNSSVILNQWNERTQELAQQLVIQRIITLAESVRVNSPIVLGYLKPVIILPTGMLSGLSSEQIEMIILHELMHIKRHDYLVNIGQMILESIFFFNPFVWILSAELREEREHCCDDAVVRHLPNPIAYVSALAQLEEVRMNHIEPALGFAQNKNRLLNRIKRLMENSVKNYSARSRVVPALLLVIGLICASWLTISKEPNALAIHPDNVLASQDTSMHPKNKKGSYSRTQVVITDEDGEPWEEIVETYDGDFASFGVSPVDPPDMPGVPDFDFDIDMVAPPTPDFIFEIDTIPGKASYFSLHEFEKFSQEFQTKFKEQFGCVGQNQKDMDIMMKDFQKNLETAMRAEIEANIHADVHAEIAKNFQIQEEVMARNREHHAEAMAAHQEAMARMNEDMDRWETEHGEKMKELEKNLQHMEENMKKFEKELQKELIKDGYLKAGEELKNIHWDTKGDIEINGQKLKAEHKKKYNALHDKFFSEKDFIYTAE